MAKTDDVTEDLEVLITPREVAEIFRVHPKTVTRWAMHGKLRFTRTLGGHRRYYKSQIEEIVAAVKAEEGKRMGITCA